MERRATVMVETQGGAVGSSAAPPSGGPAAAGGLEGAGPLVEVEEAFLTMRKFYSNLLDGLGATDSFVLDGNAVLLELLGDARMDWAHGGQFLQLRWLLESLVASVAKANTARLPFYIVFFDASGDVLPGATATLARALASRWLPALGIPILRFSSWWSPEWRRWLAATRPALMLLTDLPQPAAGGGLGLGGAEGGESAGGGDTPGSGPTTQAFLRAQVVHTALHGVQCAFLRELRFSELAMFGFRATWRSAERKGSAELLAAVEAVGGAFAAAAARAAAAAEATGAPEPWLGAEAGDIGSNGSGSKGTWSLH